LTSLAAVTNLSTGESTNNSFVGVGTSNGAVCIYSLEPESGEHWLNITDIAGPTKYSESSAVTGIQFLEFNNLRYGYWANANGKIWRVIADQHNKPISKGFTELTDNPGKPTKVLPHTLLVTQGNDVIIGGQAVQGQVTKVYVLLRGANRWQAVNLGSDNSAVKAISLNPDGVPVVMTQDTKVYYLNNTNKQ